MSQFLGLSVLVLFVVQGYGLQDPNPSKVAEYKGLVAEWAETAKRIIRSLESRPQEEAEEVSSQLREGMEEGRRQKRSPQDLQNVLQGFNDGLKQLMANVTSSSIYQEMEKLGENLNSKGKELYGQFQEQVKNLQNKASSSSSTSSSSK
ncbi:uncharacterized protein [Halyomorpha halys]|uniref:uncharacterized protein n=1 Tax=Halyomorpha halys TaxID=286706 RepID=UPI0006D4F482|nr:uncharacterized protein LOC106686234 [Halyomorpha halys]